MLPRLYPDPNAVAGVWDIGIRCISSQGFSDDNKTSDPGQTWCRFAAVRESWQNRWGLGFGGVRRIREHLRHSLSSLILQLHLSSLAGFHSWKLSSGSDPASSSGTFSVSFAG